MSFAKTSFKEKGFAVLNNVFAKQAIEIMQQNIMTDILQCASELNCNFEKYTTNVSRWLHPSPVTQSIQTLVDLYLKKIVSDFIQEEIRLCKINIIVKTRNANHPIPCHQDIAYSGTDPYEFSIWLPLQDVTLMEGALEFLPGSHLTTIEPAVDFWQPDFIDKMFLSANWQKNYISAPVKIGDAIIFDSRIWHRSARNQSGNNRFALVTRWSRLSYCNGLIIPDKIPAKFGMWTCGQLTELILQQGLLACFQIKITADLETYINLWKIQLSKYENILFIINIAQAQKSLDNLLILHQASKLHNGGDAQGLVYQNLWNSLLKPLAKYIEQNKFYSDDAKIEWHKNEY